MSYGIIFWGVFKQNLDKIFVIQKRCLRIMAKVPRGTHCRPFFKTLKILTAPCVVIYKCAIFVKTNRGLFPSVPNNRPTRQGLGKVIVPVNNYCSTDKGPLSFAPKIYNALPEDIRLERRLGIFKTKLQELLVDRAFYSIEEFLGQ